MLTYGDGVSDVDLNALLAFHKAHGKLATVTGVRPPARFGGLTFNGDEVVSFIEKAKAGEGWINGGFFVLEPGVFDYIEGDDTYWEREPMQNLAADRQLYTYRHEGFWQSMDTLRDVRMLNELWASCAPPWKTWHD
jgi:glucose-1-phosphate cytidylyltransferase